MYVKLLSQGTRGYETGHASVVVSHWPSHADHGQIYGQGQTFGDYKPIHRPVTDCCDDFHDGWLEHLLSIEFAQATLRYEAISRAPCEIDISMMPKVHYSWKERTIKRTRASETLNEPKLISFAKA